MSTLVLIHIVTGLVGIAAGGVALAGMFFGHPMPRWNGLFLSTTFASCATGFAFLPIDGVTSAQLVSFYTVALLAVAAHARYGRGLRGRWTQVYAVAALYTVFLDTLIATTQSFQHVGFLRSLAPSQQSPVFVGVKVTLLLLTLAIALILARRVGRHIPS